MSRFEVKITVKFNDNWGKYKYRNVAINEAASLEARLRSIIDCNPDYGVVVASPIALKEPPLSATTYITFDDNAASFPGIFVESYNIPIDLKDGPIISNYEVHVKCNPINTDECTRVMYFIDHQFHSMQAYKDNKITYATNDDRSEVLLNIDGELCIRPLILPIYDTLIMNIGETYPHY